MGFATISLIPEKTEPAFWFVIFVFCAYVIAKVFIRKHFLYGFLTSLVNSVWITAAHLLFFNTYVANHPDAASLANHMGYFSSHPRQLMLLFGLPFGAAFGIILGLFCVVASKLVIPNANNEAP
jgi:hypothetical protein